MRRDNTIVNIVEDKLYERSMIRYQSFKKSVNRNASVKKRPGNLYDEELRKIKTDLMHSIVQKHDKSSARSASLESHDKKLLLVQDIEEAENLMASML